MLSFSIICILMLFGILCKPWRVPDYIWALCGAAALILTGSVSFAAAGHAVGDSIDVVEFLIGMMLLSELASQAGVFTYLADHAAVLGRGRPVLLYAIVYGCGIVVTMLLSNDATAVVMTPAVVVIARRAKVDPIPLVLACAFVANAASFLLPVANPANLVLYASHPPPVSTWLQAFFLPSCVAVVTTALLLWFTQRKRLSGSYVADTQPEPLSGEIRTVMIGIAAVAAALLTASQASIPLGIVTLVLALIVLAIVVRADRARVASMFSGVSWGVLILVAALFVVASAADHVGLTAELRRMAADAPHLGTLAAASTFASCITVLSMFANNLPIGLFTSHFFIGTAQPVLGMETEFARRVAVVAIDLGPNISITAALSTMLWLQALKKADIPFGNLAFLRVSLIVLPLSMLATLAVLR